MTAPVSSLVQYLQVWKLMSHAHCLLGLTELTSPVAVHGNFVWECVLARLVDDADL